jgi:threonine dehydrogenase-like Zn-dependent dehydrogenase
MAARCAWLFGAGRVIVIDHIDYRLDFVKNYAPCEAYNFRSLEDPVVFIKRTTGWMGADVVIDAVGAEAAGNAMQTLLGRKLLMHGGSATALHWAINSVKKGVAVSRSGAGSVVGLKIFFAVLELLILAAGFYIFKNRKKFFGYKGEEGDTYASANLRMIMVVLVWIHAVIITALMIYEV